MKQIKITVSWDHIQKGKPLMTCCPIALALRDAGYFKPSVTWGPGYKDALFSTDKSGKKRCRALLSNPAQKFAKDFDARKYVEPATFYLKVHYWELRA